MGEWSRTPQSNSYVERFNRTIQEEFVDCDLDFLEDTEGFNDRLIDYLIFFSTARPHQALKLGTKISRSDGAPFSWWVSVQLCMQPVQELDNGDIPC